MKEVVIWLFGVVCGAFGVIDWALAAAGKEKDEKE